MSLLLPSQLDAIRATDFDFNAGFLDRMAAAMDDYLAAGGLSAAASSPGPLHEIAENHALLVEIIAGANARTRNDDRSHVSGIKGLSVRLEALREFCQGFTGMSVEALAAEPKLLELTYAEWLELQRNHRRMREKLRVTISIVREITEGLGTPPFDPASEHSAKETWGVATMTLQNALPVFGYMPETRAVLDELGTVIDALGELIS